MNERRTGRILFWFAGMAVYSLFLIGLGVSQFVDSWHTLPAKYADLSRHGVRATARFEGCAGSHLTGRDVHCRLSVVFGGRKRTWDYGENYPQFDHLQPGAAVAVLIDPRNPGLAYTVTDVEHRTNTGGFAYLGLVFVALGLAPWATVWWLTRASDRSFRRLMRERGA